ncbi:hypothetical protein L211DRAFT_843758 [Terfezia boudieri ATCC MYA-4762]|uniref:Uncharacterized protein n=1 Tax=Terfezia boudieri ATCC MYA-4762 TaxID=1051890 RepID=A0A3N4LCE0_9PEZI|nr:hypothetical protein L211DRAFT_843758 [Terfezia boudieri ATCC MYA-4762]
MSRNNYPRLLPAPAPAINDTAILVPDTTCTTHPLLADLLTKLSDRLQEGSHTTTKRNLSRYVNSSSTHTCPKHRLAVNSKLLPGNNWG